MRGQKSSLRSNQNAFIPTEILVKFAIPSGRVQLQQIRVVIGNELLALFFSTTTSLEEVFICHAAREVDINSPSKDTYQGHSPIILCAVTLNRQFITQKKLRIRLARSTTWPNNMYYITVYTSSVSSPVMTDFNISISLMLFCVKNCYQRC